MAVLKGLQINKCVFFNTTKINLTVWWVVGEELEFT